jgi:hypothetical protein
MPGTRRLWATGALILAVASCAGASHGNAAAFCARLKVDLTTLMGSPSDPNAKKAVVDAFHRLRPLAPSAIASDWQRLSDLVDLLANYDPSTNDPFGSTYAAALDPKVQAAAAKVRAWSQTNCGVELAVGTPVTSTPGSSTP